MRLLLSLVFSTTASTPATAADSTTTVSWCTDTSSNALLTYCGDVCSLGDPCVQYLPSSSCNEASRNDCIRYTPECTYQCLDAYNTLVKKFTVFIKEPASSDAWTGSFSGSSTTTATAAFPSAEIDTVKRVVYDEATRNIQLTGFDETNVQKGSLKSVTFDENTFATAKVLEQLILNNLDLGMLPFGFLPTTISLLTMENCNLANFPSQLGNLANKNLVTLNLNKNTMTSVTDTDSAIAETLRGLTTLNLADNLIATFEVVLPLITTLDLSNNKLTEFPSAIFNMTNLNILNIAGNSINSLTVTSAQYNFLRKLSSASTLAITSSACSSSTATDVLDSVVCVSDDFASLSDESSNSSSGKSTLIIVVIVLAVAVVLGTAGFFLYRHRMKNRGYYVPNTPDMVGIATPPSANNTPARNWAGSRGRASSQQRTPAAGGRTPRSSIPNLLQLAGFSDHGKKMFDAQPRRNSAQSTLPAKISRSRGSIIHSSVVQIPSGELNYTRKLAKGAFGEVWLALHGTDLVAVKKLITVEGTSVQDFVSELNLLASLSHRCILTLIGACWDDELTDIQIVMEYMDSGDLLSVLRENSPSVLTWENSKATYCVQVCEAVYYLHSLQPALIHRDIKSRNILVDSKKGAKLSDFGESRERTVARTMTAGVGTARWVAPEIILGEDYSELADIYSLGVLLTEIDTHQIPYQTLELEESMIVQQVAVGKLRPKVSDTCPEVIRRLTHECLQYDPSLRPSAARVLQSLLASPLFRHPSVDLTEE